MVANYVVLCNPAGNCMFKVNNRNTRTRCEICLKLVNKKDTSGLALVSLLLNFNIFHTLCFIVNFEKINAGWQYFTFYMIVSYLEQKRN